MDEQHPSFKKFLKGKSNKYQTSNPQYLKTLINYEQSTEGKKNPHAPLKALQEYRNLRKIQDPRRVDQERDPFVTYEKPVPSSEDENAMDKRFCKFKVLNDRVMVVNRGKTEMRMQKEIALQEERPVSPVKITVKKAE